MSDAKTPSSFFRICALRLKEELGLAQAPSPAAAAAPLIYTASTTWLSSDCIEEAKILNKERIRQFRLRAAALEKRIFPPSRITASKQAQIKDLVDLYMGIKPIESIPHKERDDYINMVNSMPQSLPCAEECASSLQVHRAAFTAAGLDLKDFAIYTDTERQKAIYDLISGHRSYKDINVELGINRSTMWRYLDLFKKAINQPQLSLKELKLMCVANDHSAAQFLRIIQDMNIPQVGRPAADDCAADVIEGSGLASYNQLQQPPLKKRRQEPSLLDSFSASTAESFRLP